LAEGKGSATRVSDEQPVAGEQLSDVHSHYWWSSVSGSMFAGVRDPASSDRRDELSQLPPSSGPFLIGHLGALGHQRDVGRNAELFSQIPQAPGLFVRGCFT